jgi:hypothetical protein
MGLTGKIVFCKKTCEDKLHYSMFTKRVPASVIDEVDEALKSLETDGTIDKILAVYKQTKNRLQRLHFNALCCRPMNIMNQPKIHFHSATECRGIKGIRTGVFLTYS